MTTVVFEKIRPLVFNGFQVPGSTLRFSASCFGGIDWSLRRLQKDSDVHQHWDYANRLCSALKSVGAKYAFAPYPADFNGKIIGPAVLDNYITLGERMYIRRNQKAPADGTFLCHECEAGIFSAGGCGVIVATYHDLLIFAHAGRNSLLDREWVMTDGIERTRGREHISVVDSMITALDVPKDRMQEVHFWPLYFIKPENFIHRTDDNEHGVYNRAACRFLPVHYDSKCCQVSNGGIQLDLPGIARLQCLRHGVPSSNIHMEHCYLADDLPHTRKGEGTSRYLVAIVRNS